MTKYQPVNAVPPPKDGTWFLLRGRNSAGQPMIPVVASWTFGSSRGSEKTWRDSANLRNVSFLIVDVPPGASADWMPLPEGWDSVEVDALVKSKASGVKTHYNTKWGTPARYWWIAVLKALEELGGGPTTRIRILELTVENNNRRSIQSSSVKSSATIALVNASVEGLIEKDKPYYTITSKGREFLKKNLSVYEDFNK